MSNNTFISKYIILLFVALTSISCYKQKPPYSTFSQKFNRKHFGNSIEENEISFIYNVEPIEDILSCEIKILQLNAPLPDEIILNNQTLNFSKKKHEIDISKKLKKGENSLIIKIKNQIKQDSKISFSNNYLSPKLIGINNGWVTKTEIRILESEKDVAFLRSIFSMKISHPEKFKLRIGNVVKDTILKIGNHEVSLDFEIINPKWWNGKKSAHTYKLYSQVFSPNNTISDTIFYFPLRKIKIIKHQNVVKLNDSLLTLCPANLSYVIDSLSYLNNLNLELLIDSMSKKGINSFYFQKDKIHTEKIHFMNNCAYYGIIPIEVN